MRRSRSREDVGDTLVEVLITVMILGITAAGLVGAMTTASIGSGSHQDEAYAQSLAVAAAERVESAAYTNCAQASDYVTAAQSAYSSATVPAPWTASRISVAAVQYWTTQQPSPLPPAGWTTNSGLCTDSATFPGGLQRIEVKVTSPDQKATEFVWLIKRKP